MKRDAMQLTVSGPNLHRAYLLCVQASDFIRHLAVPDIPEPQRAVEVTRADEVLIPGAAHRVAAAVADDGTQAVALVQVPHFDASVCAAADCPERGAGTAVNTAHLQHTRTLRVT